MNATKEVERREREKKNLYFLMIRYYICGFLVDKNIRLRKKQDRQ